MRKLVACFSRHDRPLFDGWGSQRSVVSPDATLGSDCSSKDQGGGKRREGIHSILIARRSTDYVAHERSRRMVSHPRDAREIFNDHVGQLFGCRALGSATRDVLHKRAVYIQFVRNARHVANASGIIGLAPLQQLVPVDKIEEARTNSRCATHSST